MTLCNIAAVWPLARHGGHGGYVVGLVTLSTLIGMLGLPAALLVLKALS